MIISILGIAIVALGGYIWLTRGFYSALLNLVCTVIAGAIAFAFWEQTSFLLLDAGAEFLRDAAWGLGLALPFALALAVLRVIVDSTLRANVKVAPAVDAVGGGVLGALAGCIVAGFSVNSIGYMRVETGFLDATPIKQARSGIAREGGPFFPIDRWVGNFYGFLSKTGFQSDSPLAKYYPRLDEVPAGLRITDSDGAARNTMRLDDYELLHTYTVSGSKEELLTDKWRSKALAAAQEFKYLNGNPPGSDDVLYGVVLKFNSGSYEKFGQFVTTNGPIRILADNGTEIEAYHPFAANTKAEAIDDRTKKPKYGRFAFESAGFAIASKGGDTDCVMAFEFLLPKNAKPFCIYVRNQRRDLPAESVKLSSTAQRDGAVDSGTLLKKGFDPSKSETVTASDLDKRRLIQVKYAAAGSAPTAPPENFQVGNSLGITLMEGSTDHLDVDTENGNVIVGGEGKFEFEVVDKMQRTGLDRKLRVEKFQVTDDTVLVQIEMNKDAQIGLTLAAFQEANQASEAPTLVDKNGASFRAIGFIYQDKELYSIRYTPGQPIQGLSEMPSISLSRPNQKIRVLFRVTKGASIQYMTVGKTVVAEYVPAYPIPLK